MTDYRCSICGCREYTLFGNTVGGKWLFVCSNEHTWAEGSIHEPFPWREDDYYNPKYWEYDGWGTYVRMDEPSGKPKLRVVK